MSQLTAADLEEIKRTAINAGLADPMRRSLLLAWLPRALTMSLPRMTDPASQLGSDLYELLQYELKARRPALSVWLENAERLTEVYPGVPAVFAAARRRLSASAIAGETPKPIPPPPRSQPQVQAADTGPQPLERIEILMVAAQTNGVGRDLDDELLRTDDVLKKGLNRDRITTTRLNDADTFRIQQGLLKSSAHVLHFSGHGFEGGRVALMNQGKVVQVDPDGIRDLLELAQEDTADFRIALFNTGYSGDLAEALVRSPAVVPCAIGTSEQIEPGVAIEFARGFYNSLADGKDVHFAFRAGRAAVGLLGAPLARRRKAFHIFMADGVEPATLLLRTGR